MRVRSVRHFHAVLVLLSVTLLAAFPARADPADDVAALDRQAAQLAREGKYAEAAAPAKQALALAERTLGPAHPATLKSVHSLGAVYRMLGRYGEAEPLYKRALAGRERALGAEHADTLASANHLGLLYQAMSRHGDAEPLLKRALGGQERARGPEHPETLLIANNLGSLYRAMGRHGDAEPLLTRALAGFEKANGPEHLSTLQSAGQLGSLYHEQGRYGEAEPLLKRSLAGHEKLFGPEHPNTLASVNALAGLYQAQARYGEAEALFQRALDGRERTLGPEHPNTLSSLNNLGLLYRMQARHAEAEPLYKRALAGRERALGPEHPGTLQSVNNLALLYQAMGRLSEVEPLLKRSLAGHEKALGPDHPETVGILNNLGSLQQARGRYAEAEPLFQRALASRERVLGAEHPNTLQSIGNLSGLYLAQGRYGEAEAFARRALAGLDRVHGPEHPSTLAGVNALGLLYRTQGRLGEAEPLYKRALAGRERALGPEHPNTLQSVNNLGLLYRAQGRFGEAEPLLERALAGNEKALGPEHPTTLQSVGNLGYLYQAQNRYAEAEPLFQRARAGLEKALGPTHPNTLQTLGNLAALYLAQGRYGEAEPLQKRALAGFEKLLGPEHPNSLQSVDGIARLHFAKRDWPGAVALWRRNTATIAARVQRGVEGADQPPIGQRKSEAERMGGQFRSLVKATWRLTPEGRLPDAATSREMFETAQWALGSEAAKSLAQMAARGAAGDGKLAALVRERQDLVAEWQKREELQTAIFGEEAGKRDASAEAENAAAMSGVGKRIAGIDTQLAAEFPGYATLASPAPLSVKEVQAQLGADEALIMFLAAGKGLGAAEETFLWVVTSTDLRWVSSEIGPDALVREVRALRCGLDYTQWTDPTGWRDATPEQKRAKAEQAVRRQRCLELTGTAPAGGDTVASVPITFDLARAHKLYKGLFGGVEDLIASKKHLLLVPTGPLTQLPFQVLVTAPAAGTDYRAAAWLARSHALTILPAVSSLKALRTTARPSAAAKTLIGFGNPLLDGPDAGYAQDAKLARDKQVCAPSAPARVAALKGQPNEAMPVETRGGLADVSFIRKQPPLPETADELCAVARDVGADASQMRLGAKATERALKAASASGELANYRIVHFATHGVTAGQLSQAAEPGLILTPPKEASAEDDGYLSASEIAALKLDADWVILSACNTAAGNASNAEALSGLARAFIYAQARALLVSHWEVYSEATVKLITAAMREVTRNKSVGRAEALRRSMVALIERGEPHEAHPAFWAPFVVVGEGAK